MIDIWSERMIYESVVGVLKRCTKVCGVSALKCLIYICYGVASWAPPAPASHPISARKSPRLSGSRRLAGLIRTCLAEP